MLRIRTAVSGLPPGLSFNRFARTVSGTPTEAGGYTVTYTVEDAPPIPVGKMYWTSTNHHIIKRANIDGSQMEVLLNHGDPVQIALHGDKMYWTDSVSPWCGPDPGGVIARSNLDGSDIEELVETTGQSAPYGIAIHGGRIYWTDRRDWGVRGGGKILRSNLDGTGTKVLVDDLQQPLGLVVHNRRLYWITNHGMIQRANLDGTGVTTLVPAEGFPGSHGRGLAIY